MYSILGKIITEYNGRGVPQGLSSLSLHL